MTATLLWASVVAAYPTSDLVSLTNPRNTQGTGVDTAWGEAAAQETIDLFPVYAQVAFDANDPQHMAVGRHATIAVLYSRGGTAQSGARMKWEDVFSDSGLLGRLRKTSARGHASPQTNSQVQTASEAQGGAPVKPWAGRESLPGGLLPNRGRAR